MKTQQGIWGKIMCAGRKKMKAPMVPFFQLFRYATIWEKCISLLGLVFATIAAFGIPWNVVTYGEFTTLLVDRTSTFATGSSTPTLLISLFGGGRILTNATREENRIALIEDSEAFGLACATGALLQLICCLLAVDLTNFAALKQITRIRLLFLQAVLRQDMTWYDTATGNNFAARITDDLEKLKEGIADKLAIFVYLVMSFMTCVLFALIYGWKLTLVILSCAPIIIISTAFVAKMQSSLTAKELKSYSVAANIAEEVLSSIRTVVAFGGLRKEVARYEENLAPAERTGKMKGMYSGLGGGLMWGFIYCCYALAFWYGLELIIADRDNVIKEYTPAVIIIVLFGVLAGAQNLGFTSPHIEAFSTARGSAQAIFDIIDRKPQIDSMATSGLCPPKIEGNIRFENIFFRYPARSDVPILRGLNLTVEPGQTVSLVGHSGCGKSTCLQLLQRLYDPEQGSVTINGVNIKEMNVTHLRSFMGVVGQEPVLFSATIAENIRLGRPEATQQEIEEATKQANCHDFISKLPNGYNTMIGEQGGQLSGGQKQRIAIARALVRNPSILVLDEATSALDPHSERLVQDALDKASKGRTTIVVSHRLSTITNSDKIVFIEQGEVMEEGTHQELLDKKGYYYRLVNTKSDSEVEGEKKAAAVEPKKERKRLESQLSMRKSIDDSSDDEEADEVEMPDDEEVPSVSMIRIFKLNSPEWRYLLVGSIAAIVVGASLPIFAILFGEFYGIMSIPDESEARSEGFIYAMYFLVLGVAAGLGTFYQTYMFNIAGVKLTSRLRSNVFEATMKQEMGWYDEPRNGVGVLCARLAGDCASVQGACGTRLGSMVQAFSTLLIGIAVALYFNVKLTCVAIISVPVVLAACYYESKYTAISALNEKSAMEGGCKMAVEAIANIKTVASLGQEAHVLKRYTEEVQNAETACRKKIRYRGTVYALGQTTPIFGYALAFYYGGLLVANEGLEYKNVIKISEALIFGAWMLAQALSYAPNVNVAVLSAARMLKLLDRVPNYVQSTKQPVDQAPNVKGNVNFVDVEFSYPTRKDVQVLKKLNLAVLAGKNIALVGPSGCGKSTCIQLLLRYYDTEDGYVELDGTKTTDYTLDCLRSQIGLVSQEPVLFDRTIAENIAYGDNSRTVPMDEIVKAAQQANIHTFVTKLPAGYDTRLGRRGAQLSGGQKQRIAIARALVRNPKILLLDEATSSLDRQSEVTVQEALELAQKGRTCITIAHRLTTVKNADLICVLSNGRIIEQGSHDELMANGKTYPKMYQMQQVN